MKRDITLHINNQDYPVTVPTHHTLLQILREQFHLYGVREGCGVGMCGACTVLLDGNPISACLFLAIMAEGKKITTIEGLSQEKRLHPVQQAYIDQAAFQCAYCTPGFILATVALLEGRPNPDDETIRDYLAGNLCRCGSYNNILEAVRQCRQSPRSQSS